MNQPPHDESPIEAQVISPPAHQSVAKAAASSMTDGRWMVLAILFGVTGALGIPLLWVSKKFSLAERIFWSIVVTIYTLALVGVTAAIVMWSYRMIMGG